MDTRDMCVSPVFECSVFLSIVGLFVKFDWMGSQEKGPIF